MQKGTILFIFLILLGIAFTVAVSVIAYRNYHKEDFRYSVLKDSISMASGSNILINLDQAFGFFAGLNSDAPLPLNVAECLTGMYNNKEKLILLANFIYQYHTGLTTKEEMDSRIKLLGEEFPNWMEKNLACRKICENKKNQVPQLFNPDQILGFLTGTIISEANEMKFPCYQLISYVQQFLNHNDINAVLEYTNLDLKIKGGVCTKEYAENRLKSLNIDTQHLQASLKTYCEQWCEGKIC